MEVSSEEGHSITSPRSADMTDDHKTMNGRLWSFTNIYKIKRRQITEYPTMQTLLLAYQSLGVVYGDLGTSPLYVFPSISISNPGERDILGIMSLIFWTLTLIALVKYTCIVLYADDHGEGGTFALYSFLSQHVNLQSKMTPHNARLGSDINLKYHSKESILQSKTKQFLEKSSKARLIITLLVFLGTSMVIGDGALTPAISVLSAVQGIQSRSSKIDTKDVVLLSVLLLLLLFLFQRFGTSKVSISFSPIMVIWFFSTAGIGVYNIFKYYPGIFKALSPHYIYYFFSDRHKKGWELLGEIALCITGAEAMFADLGHFNKRAIQIAFSTIVYPSLILAYGGEAAYLIKNPGNIKTTFYSCIPSPLFWPMFVIATLAAIVASQSLISASFSIIRQAMALGCFPRVNMIHTSNKHEGQVYSPEINYFLMIACILIVVGFKGGVEIANAFGVAVIWVMLITTGLMAMVMLVIWDTNIILISIFTLTFIAIEGVYMTSLLNKLPQGGWVPFAISIFFLILICSWTYGRKKKYDYEANMRMSKADLIELLSDGGGGGGEINRVPGICFFYTDLVNGIPPIIRHYVHHVSSLREIMVIVTVRTLPIKSVLSEERFLVAKMGPKGVYRCLVQYGYMDEPNMEGEDYIASLIERLKEQAAEGEEEEEMLETSNNNNKGGVVFVMGRIILRSNAKNGWLQKLVINGIYRFLQKNSTSTISTFRIPPGKTLQVGMLYEI